MNSENENPDLWDDNEYREREIIRLREWLATPGYREILLNPHIEEAKKRYLEICNYLHVSTSRTANEDIEKSCLEQYLSEIPKKYQREFEEFYSKLEDVDK